MPSNITFMEALKEHFADKILSMESPLESPLDNTIEISSEHVLEIATFLRDEPSFKFEMLMDLCGIDYLDYGKSEWETKNATNTGYSRGVEHDIEQDYRWKKPRFAVVYHLLSITHRHRLRMRAFVNENTMIIPSVTGLWSSANWFEREAFDLFGILFDNHPDLRRILTDYGFMGHPFRKDFPLIGHTEVRYSATDQRVIYQPVTIPERTLVPKTIRDDHRYLEDSVQKESE